MYAYFGSEFYFPSWVSCDQKYCITGDGSEVRLYTEHPIDDLRKFNGDVPDPLATLENLGLSTAEARDLLKLD